MGTFGIKGASAGQASVVVIKVFLALGRFGSTCWSGHDDLKKKGKDAAQLVTEHEDVSRATPPRL